MPCQSDTLLEVEKDRVSVHPRGVIRRELILAALINHSKILRFVVRIIRAAEPKVASLGR